MLYSTLPVSRSRREPALRSRQPRGRRRGYFVAAHRRHPHLAASKRTPWKGWSRPELPRSARTGNGPRRTSRGPNQLTMRSEGASLRGSPSPDPACRSACGDALGVEPTRRGLKHLDTSGPTASGCDGGCSDSGRLARREEMIGGGDGVWQIARLAHPPQRHQMALLQSLQRVLTHLCDHRTGPSAIKKLHAHRPPATGCGQMPQRLLNAARVLHHPPHQRAR